MGTPQRHRLWLLPVVYYLSFLLLLVGYWFVYAFAPDFHEEWFRGEDKLVETLTFMSFALASVVFVMMLKFRPVMGLWSKLYFVGLAAFCFVCAGEEISWGQRIFGFGTPESMIESNEQHEFNLHNLDFKNFHPIVVITMFTIVFGMALPLLAGRSTSRRDGAWRRYVAPLYLVPCFAFAQGLNTIQKSFKPWILDQFGHDVYVIVRSDMRELTEMYWGICLMLAAFSIYAAWALRRSQMRETA